MIPKGCFQPIALLKKPPSISGASKNWGDKVLTPLSNFLESPKNSAAFLRGSGRPAVSFPSVCALFPSPPISPNRNNHKRCWHAGCITKRHEYEIRFNHRSDVPPVGKDHWLANREGHCQYRLSLPLLF